MSKKLNRRGFLSTSAVTAVTLPVLTATNRASVIGAGERLRIGIIGCGSIGTAHLGALLKQFRTGGVEIVAVCDIYKTRAAHFQDRIWKAGGHADRYSDYRNLLETEGLDYVVVAVPEHWHAQITLDALDCGLHVYCEKPLAYDLEGAKQVVDKVHSSGKLLQVGVQGMSEDSYVTAREAIRAGKLGPVVEAQIDFVRNFPLGRGPWRTGVDPDLPKPADLDWETWLGPAPKRPWSPARYFEWRCYRDYSGGIATDVFPHPLTRILRACDLQFPLRVTGMGGIYLWDDGRELPDNFEMLLEYPAVEGVTAGMTVHVLGTFGNKHGIDHVIRGHKATLQFTDFGWQIVEQSPGYLPAPPDERNIIEKHQKTGAEEIILHHKNLQQAIRQGDPLNCPAELGLYAVAAVVGANQSWFDKRMLNWDSKRQQWDKMS